MMDSKKMARENEKPDSTSAAETASTLATAAKILQFPGPTADDQERIAAFRCAAEMLLRAADEIEKKSRRKPRLP
jgi:hypothetical protein